MRRGFIRWGIPAIALFIPAIAMADGTLSIPLLPGVTADPATQTLAVPKWNPAAYPGATLTQAFLVPTISYSGTLNVGLSQQGGVPSSATYVPVLQWGINQTDLEGHSIAVPGLNTITVTTASPNVSDGFNFSGNELFPPDVTFANNAITGTGTVSEPLTLSVEFENEAFDIHASANVTNPSLSVFWTAMYDYSGTIVPEPASISLLCSAPILLMRRRRRSA